MKKIPGESIGRFRTKNGEGFNLRYSLSIDQRSYAVNETWKHYFNQEGQGKSLHNFLIVWLKIFPIFFCTRREVLAYLILNSSFVEVLRIGKFA